LLHHTNKKLTIMKKTLLFMMVLLSLAWFRVNALGNLTATNSKNIQKTVTGKVVDDKGQPLPGVVVKIKRNPSIAVTTNVKGNYSIVLPGDDETLVFSFVGFDTREVATKDKTVINITMTAANLSLDEVVVVAYGSQKRKSVTGAVTPRALRAPAPAVMINNAVSVRDMKDINSFSSPGVAYPNDESYRKISENTFIDPKTTPLSTFAVDVDAASYANVRRFINNGQLPPKSAVRIEEMINYFHYDLPAPTNGEPVTIQTGLSAAPWNPQHQLVRIGLKAKNVKTSNLPPSNLVFLLDVSGSMDEPNKLPLVKTSMKMLVDQLRPIDNVAIVVYAGEAGVKLESTPGDQKQKIKDAIDQLGAGGSTAGGEGIKMAYQIAKKKFIKGGNNRIILATDGDFNVGPSSDKDMEQLITEERGSGVSISILGFGMGNLKDSKMERMADKGHGNYAYIDNITEATKSMVTEFGGTLFTVAKDVKLQVEFNPGKVQAYRLLGYEDRLMQKEDFNNDY
jgi:Ca-activated chloride channel family protein